ncbi:MAG: site-specific integrase, partial [Ktedonobacteraceae bacterium]|nr:site-specific integrase [Ktedonobacteraceae bacterium]
MGVHRKSIVREVIERFDTKMAIGAGRRAAKQALRKSGQRVWTHSTGQIHAFKTRSDYQEHTIRFMKWVRAEHHIISLAQLDPRVEELASTYLAQRLAEGKSPYTLQAERAALRLFFENRALAASVPIPKRARGKITRSRGAKKHDRYFQP